MGNFYAPFERQYSYPGEWANDLAGLMLTTGDDVGASSIEMLMNTISRNDLNDMSMSMEGVGETLYEE